MNKELYERFGVFKKIKKTRQRQRHKVTLIEERGKGSHCTLEYGDRFTIIRNLKDELKTGTFNAMLKQLGIKKNELR